MIKRLYRFTKIPQVLDRSEPVLNTEETLSVSLGPGLLTQIYDGIQRPLATLEEVMGVFITRGVDADAFDLEKKWTFEAKVAKGDELESVKSLVMFKKLKLLSTKSWFLRVKVAK